MPLTEQVSRKNHSTGFGQNSDAWKKGSMSRAPAPNMKNRMDSLSWWRRQRFR